MGKMLRRFHFLVLLLSLLITGCAASSSLGTMRPAMRMDGGMMQRHMAPLPAQYAGLTSPIPADAESLARGKVNYEAKCAVCHGVSGWGDGPAAANLDPAPAPIAHTAPMLSDAYLFYRISEGGDFAPFNSAMPMWKEKVSETERWDVINYIRSLGNNSMMNGGGMMMNGGMMGGDVWWMMAPWWLLGWALVISIIAAIALVVVWAVRRSSRSVRTRETPLEILKRRFAQGEITPDQFETMKRQLGER